MLMDYTWLFLIGLWITYLQFFKDILEFTLFIYEKYFCTFIYQINILKEKKKI